MKTALDGFWLMNSSRSPSWFFGIFSYKCQENVRNVWNLRNKIWVDTLYFSSKTFFETSIIVLRLISQIFRRSIGKIELNFNQVISFVYTGPLQDLCWLRLLLSIQVLSEVLKNIFIWNDQKWRLFRGASKQNALKTHPCSKWREKALMQFARHASHCKQSIKAAIITSVLKVEGQI